ncbi:family 2 glycosyl transferase [Nakamurella antarctica]|uniref:Family 2 glycosyl transferase n=1 Tax=Nakamurella antarctica TaxID=1902245 RepID=A0A3G8ZPT5_9ACTN|nr:glycosyltransferase [Nakamurella antarctica]AZI59158.1 family 2 glycosyl transferase [Nakamurella antarctica]
MRVLRRAIMLFLSVKLLTLLSNLFAFPTLRRSSSTKTSALLIPMRDETDRLPQTLEGLLGSGATTTTFLDDQSSDGTGQMVESALAATSFSSGKVIVGTARPQGWTGKTWACAQLADSVLLTAQPAANPPSPSGASLLEIGPVARHRAPLGETLAPSVNQTAAPDYLIFVDADIYLAPNAIPAIIAEATRQSADVLSIFPRQVTRTWSERALVPLVNDVLLCFLPFALLKAPVKQAATANGSVLAFRTAAYEALGGFAAVKGHTVEDVAMARHTRQRGLKLGLALGGDLVSTRMYTGYPDIITGFGRGLVPAAGGSRAAVLAGWAWHILAYTLPLLLIRRGPWRWAAALAVVERALVEAKSGTRDWPAAALIGLSPLAAIPVVAQAMKREQNWKGRAYR